MDPMTVRAIFLAFFWILGGFWTVYGAVQYFGSNAGWLAAGLVILLWCVAMTAAQARIMASLVARQRLEQTLRRRG